MGERPGKAANQGLTENNINQVCSVGGNFFAAGSGGHYFVSHDSGNSWQNIGTGLPETEILSANVLVSKSDTLCLAGTISSGVWIRSLSGGTWAARNSGLANLRINSIAVWDTLALLGTHEGGYLSTDRGMTWRLISKAAFPQIASLGGTVDPGTPLKTRLFCGSTEWRSLRPCPYAVGAAFTSPAIGDDWQTLPFTRARAFPSLFVRDSLAIFFCGGSTDCPSLRCYVSRDLGKSWVDNRLQIYGQSGEMKAYDKEGQAGFNLFFTATGPNAGMYSSADTGRSWRAVGASCSPISLCGVGPKSLLPIFFGVPAFDRFWEHVARHYTNPHRYGSCSIGDAGDKSVCIREWSMGVFR